MEDVDDDKIRRGDVKRFQTVARGHCEPTFLNIKGRDNEPEDDLDA